jgi:hypothetical protein
VVMLRTSLFWMESLRQMDMKVFRQRNERR